MANIGKPTTSAKASAKRPAAPAIRPASAPKGSSSSVRAGGLIKVTGASGPSTLGHRPSVKEATIHYTPTAGVDAFVSRFAKATPIEIVEVERRGIDSVFLKDLSKRMDVPAVRLFHIVGIPKATAEKKVAAKQAIAGAGGQAALGLARLLAIATGIVENSTAPEARTFDAARWLGQWIERDQPALGGRKPADLIGTPTGLDMVARVLGAIESGAYQ